MSYSITTNDAKSYFLIADLYDVFSSFLKLIIHAHVII